MSPEEEEATQRLQDRLTVAEAEIRALRRLENIDLKVELRNVIDKQAASVVQLERIFKLLVQGERDERIRKTGGGKRKRSTVQPDAVNEVPQGGSTPGADTRPV